DLRMAAVTLQPQTRRGVVVFLAGGPVPSEPTFKRHGVSCLTRTPPRAVRLGRARSILATALPCTASGGSRRPTRGTRWGSGGPVRRHARHDHARGVHLGRALRQRHARVALAVATSVAITVSGTISGLGHVADDRRGSTRVTVGP